MATQTLTESTFEQTITENDIVLVDFWADWCGPCKMFAPVFEASSEENPDVVHGKIDTEAERGLAAAANITSIPTLMAFREGILVFSQPGALPAPALKQVVDAVKGLDMEDVRRQIAAAGGRCARRDSNPHVRGHQDLNLARLPVTPLARGGHSTARALRPRTHRPTGDAALVRGRSARTAATTWGRCPGRGAAWRRGPSP